jgi:maleate isomerase
MQGTEDYKNLFEGGFGYRGRIGYLSPGIVDETLSAQFYRMAPPGVTLVRTSLELRDVTVDEVNAAVARTEAAARELGHYKPACIVFGGSPTVAVSGYGSDKAIVDMVQKVSGIKTFAAQAAAIEALQKYGANKLAVATPFPDDVNALVKDFLEKSGFEVLSIDGLKVSYRSLTLMPLRQTYELGKRCFEVAKHADAIYFAGAPQPCVSNIEPLEKELETFVISSLQASLWKALKLLGIETPINGYGRLLRELR